MYYVVVFLYSMFRSWIHVLYIFIFKYNKKHDFLTDMHYYQASVDNFWDTKNWNRMKSIRNKTKMKRKIK